MANFLKVFFLGNIGEENIPNDILERKNAFLGYKNKMFKKWKTATTTDRDSSKKRNVWGATEEKLILLTCSELGIFFDK